MLKRLAVLISGAILTTSFAIAVPFTKDDFAYTSTLSDAKSSLREIALPTSVFEQMHRKDLGDLRIFNADGQPVPHQFSRSEVLDSSQQLSLVFYPFNKEQAADGGNIQVIIKQKKDEQTLKIDKQNGQAKAAESNEYQYIIENPQSKTNDSSLCRMKLDWDQPKPSMMLALKLESSSDLQSWRSLSRKMSVSKLNYSGSELVRDEVKFGCTLSKYLRLTWLKPEQGVTLKSISGIYKKKGEQALEWHSLGKPKYDDDGNWLFESNVVAAFSQIEFDVPQDGLLFKGTLSSRKDNNDNWRRRGNITQYKLTLGDSAFNSAPKKITLNNDRFWKLELSNEAKFREEQLPEIKVAWQPKKVLFMAQGKAPFTLAYGNPAVTRAQNSDLQGLINSLSDSGVNADKVSLGEIVQGNKRFSKEDQVNWKKYVLWLLLILGTLLMAFMAWRLFQQMGSESKSDV